MFIRLYAVDDSWFDDGMGYVILGNSLDAIDEYVKNQPWAQHPKQTFEIADDSILLAMKINVIIPAKEIENGDRNTNAEDSDLQCDVEHTDAKRRIAD